VRTRQPAVRQASAPSIRKDCARLAHILSLAQPAARYATLGNSTTIRSRIHHVRTAQQASMQLLERRRAQNVEMGRQISTSIPPHRALVVLLELTVHLASQRVQTALLVKQTQIPTPRLRVWTVCLVSMQQRDPLSVSTVLLASTMTWRRASRARRALSATTRRRAQRRAFSA
jgi:hypothetical protein